MKKNLRLAVLRGTALSAIALFIALFANSATLADEEKAADKPKSDDKAKAEEKSEEKADSKTEAKSTEKSDEELRNWFDVGVGGAVVNGDKAAFQRRYGLPAGPFGGVEDFHYEEDIGKKGIFKVDGRGMFDNHDYSLKFDVEHPDVGYIRGGYREYRSYFDGSGGFYSPSGIWVSPYNDEKQLERGDFFFETGLTLPNKPNVSFRYDHMFRDGEKDSTSWGDVSVPGGMRKLYPAFWGIDETRDIFQGDVKHTLGNTTFGLGLRYEIARSDDSRNVLVVPTGGVASFGTNREKVDMDMFNVHASTETRFTEKVMLTTGYSFTTLDTDLSGYRIYGANYDSSFAQRLPLPNTFENLTGGSELQQHVATINLPLQLADSLLLVPSLRIEREDSEGSSAYDSPAAPLSGFPYGINSDRGLLDVTERLELRYTGLTNWVFYTRGEWTEGSGDIRNRWDNLGTGANVLFQSTDDTRFRQTYTVGANWYPLRRLNFGAQYYHRERSTDYEHNRDSTVNSLVGLPTTVYPAFLTAQDWTTDDANLRVTWRPRANLTLVARYDFQYSTIDTQPDSSSGLSRQQAAEMTSHIVGGSVSWSPWQRLYLMTGMNWVWDRTETPADRYAPAVQDARNDYWTANATAGYALDDKTDLQLEYQYYRADDRQNNSLVGLPYGADAQEQGVTAAVVRRITQRMRVTLKYGFFDGSDASSGHHNDYQAHLIYSSLHYRF